ncbi:uncharacterized protein KD926_010223 [Aspergillus affinis]|uniref:uncharacterized protein n=1 Tax=Aspergillus affinis TaxID=1070780 RepID=UPI0022FDE7A7|nr:uncharacterized protein KD926_010223 [Aspergillus affinis]KAI9038890.1 hypothetical protein KD926_010223 [Aspergillus affinis]
MRTTLIGARILRLFRSENMEIFSVCGSRWLSGLGEFWVAGRRLEWKFNRARPDHFALSFAAQAFIMPWKTIYYCLFLSAALLLKNLHPDWKQLLFLSGLSVVVGNVCLLLKLLVAAYLWRRLVLLDNSNGKNKFLGQPLLFPARLSHARRFPATERYNYWYDYFMVGIPVGLRGRIGNLLSIDAVPASESQRDKCWFTIDPGYYLNWGSGDLSLEEKLHKFLESQGENPQEFPYAYLISVPRFLCFQKSAISYWYLYNSERNLTAMIMEINNSFFEKRNFFFRVTGDDLTVDDPENEPKDTIAMTKQQASPVPIRFLSSAPQSKHYKGSWEKLIFGSPFEKVGGGMTAKFMDPLAGPALQSNLSSNTPEGQVKVTSRLASWGAPVDPLSASGRKIAGFIARWTHVGALSAPRIVYQAVRIRFRGKMRYLQRPEVRSGSNPRKPTSVERTLEHFFREYLSQLANNCTFPLAIKYMPPTSVHFEPIVFQAAVSPTSDPPQNLTLQPLSFRFYTSFFEQPDPKTAFSMESTPSPTDSDQESRRLSVSDISLLDKVLATSGQTVNAEIAKIKPLQASQGLEKTIFETTISFLRRSSSRTFMDNFVEHNFSAEKQREYRASLLHYLLSRRLPIESQAIVAQLFIAARVAIVNAVLHATYQIWAREPVIQSLRSMFITPATGTMAYAGWDAVHNYIGEYYLNPFAWGEGL